MKAMKAVRFEGYMQVAQFRVHSWSKREMTYPLPTYSTVIGMIHALCGWKEYHDMDISISGQSRQCSDLEIRWKGGKYSSKEDDEFCQRFPVRVESKKGYIGWARTIAQHDFLEDLNLRIHISPKNECDLEKIYRALLYPPVYPSLGRHSDLLRIDSVEITDISEDVQPLCQLNCDFPVYIPFQEHISGTVYTLHKKYQIVNQTRVFEDRKVFLFDDFESEVVSAKSDQDGYPVFLV